MVIIESSIQQADFAEAVNTAVVNKRGGKHRFDSRAKSFSAPGQEHHRKNRGGLGGEATLRAFDSGRFYGQHSVFGSMEIRYQAMHMVVMGFPMDLEIAPFLDFGQVFNSTDFEGQFNFNPGLSLRLLSRPNIGIVGNGAIGQDGLVFIGGVSLPF